MKFLRSFGKQSLYVVLFLSGAVAAGLLQRTTTYDVKIAQEGSCTPFSQEGSINYDSGITDIILTNSNDGDENQTVVRLVNNLAFKPIGLENQLEYLGKIQGRLNQEDSTIRTKEGEVFDPFINNNCIFYVLRK